MARDDQAGRGERLGAVCGTMRKDGDAKSGALWGNAVRGLAVRPTATLTCVERRSTPIMADTETIAVAL